jgi:diadenosine tetraphosphate (Ap4A) HIT family hydrolase
MTEATGTCMACDLITGSAPLPGGTILRTANWTVEHCVGPLGLGTLIVKPLRHVVHVADLTTVESSEMGPLLTRVSRAVCLWSHAGAVPGHVHFVIQPATSEAMSEHGAYGPALQMAMFDKGRFPDEPRIAELCDRLRAELDGGAHAATP